MKVYFGTSPRIKEKNPVLVDKIYRLIEKYGYKHTSHWVKEVTSEDFYALTEKELAEHHKKTIESIKAADICLFGASSRSLSVGYLANYALESGKVVVILSLTQDSLLLFRSVKSDVLITVVYNEENLEEKLKSALDEASSQTDVRFNFFITPKLLAYLDFVSQNKKVPRSVFLRDLIEREMKKDKEYKS